MSKTADKTAGTWHATQPDICTTLLRGRCVYTIAITPPAPFFCVPTVCLLICCMTTKALLCPNIVSLTALQESKAHASFSQLGVRMICQLRCAPMMMQGFFGRECANEALALAYNKPVTKAEALFEYDYYSLPEVASAALQNTVEVKVQASFSSADGYSDWVSARPELLLLKVVFFFPSCMRRHSPIESFLD